MHGHVFLVDVMGDDLRIDQVARISYEGARKVSDVRGLLRYLFRHRHTSPFEQVQITLDIKLPIFVARQLVRHRMQSLNELSGRYSELPEEFYTPPVEQVCYQATENKQGRSAPFPPEEAEQLRTQMAGEAEDAFATYHQFLEAGMAKETARLGLPLTTYTHWVTTWDLHNLLHMLGLRLDPHAQWEIRQYAEAIWTVVKAWCPLAAEAFVDYQLEAATFSRMEMSFIRFMADDWRQDQHALHEGEGRVPADAFPKQIERLLAHHGVDNLRERREFLAKLGLS